MPLLSLLVDRIRASGPMTVAAFMEAALYHPEFGYYATATRRSGRRGDFFTSVDAGPLFGHLLATLVGRVWAAWRTGVAPARFDLVEVGAGNGRLMRDLLDALSVTAPDCYESLRVTLVERSEAARSAHGAVLAPHAARMANSSEDLPPRVDGFLFANELLDALPVHRVRMTPDGLREVFVTEHRGVLRLVTGPLSTPALAAYFEWSGVTLPLGTVADVGLAAADWMTRATSSLVRGALLVIDYGDEAAHLFGGPHGDGTLTSFARHLQDPPSGAVDPARPAWLDAPGSRDVTAHVDFTSLRRAAEAAGGEVACFVDQTRLLLGLGLASVLQAASGPTTADVRRRLAAKTLVSPLALGGSHRALLVRKAMVAPGLLDPP